jgi:diphosphomevalonate decarboxylase
MQLIRRLRSAGVPVFFTIDAGPQVKAVCLPAALNQVQAALAQVPGVLDVLVCNLGAGARVIE